MIIHKAKKYRHISNYTKRIITFVGIVTIGLAFIIGQHQKTMGNLSTNQTMPHLTPIQTSKSIADSPNIIIRTSYDLKGNPPTAPGLVMKARVFNAEPSKVVYITIDDGPYPQNTPHLLEVLKKENVKATFFDVGKQIEQFPLLLKAEYEQGHSIGNHTYSHDYSALYQSADTFLADIQKNDDLIFKVIGIHSKIIRAPGGTLRFHIPYYNLLDANDYITYDWNLDTRDTDGKFSVKQLVDNVDKQIGNKKKIILLMHDLPNKSSSTNALPLIISHLKERGYSFGTLNTNILPITFPEAFRK